MESNSRDEKKIVLRDEDHPGNSLRSPGLPQPTTPPTARESARDLSSELLLCRVLYTVHLSLARKVSRVQHRTG